MTPLSPQKRPTIGITMGDPGGVGAEIIIKALADPEIRAMARYVIFGLNELMAYVADLAEIEVFWWRDQHDRFNVVPPPTYEQDIVVLDYDEFSILGLEAKHPTRAGGTASMQFVLDAINAASRGKIDAIVTAPICKAAWQAAGVSIPRDTYGQYSSLPHVPTSAIQPGDLLFFDGEGHVAIYVGGGQMIDAPQPGQNVEEVPMNSAWYSQNFDGAARP